MMNQRIGTIVKTVMKYQNKNQEKIDYNIKENLPKEDCEIWITRTCFDGSRWVQKVDFYTDNEEIIEWDGTLAWMVASDEDEKPEPYQGEYCHLIQHVDN